MYIKIIIVVLVLLFNNVKSDILLSNAIIKNDSWFLYHQYPNSSALRNLDYLEVHLEQGYFFVNIFGFSKHKNLSNSIAYLAYFKSPNIVPNHPPYITCYNYINNSYNSEFIFKPELRNLYLGRELFKSFFNFRFNKNRTYNYLDYTYTFFYTEKVNISKYKNISNLNNLTRNIRFYKVEEFKSYQIPQFNYLKFYHPVFPIIYFIFLIICFLISILFALLQRKPFHSRGIIPFIAIITSIILLLCQIPDIFINLEFLSNYHCYFFQYSNGLFTTLLVFLYPLSCLRYIILNNFNNKKLEIYNNYLKLSESFKTASKLDLKNLKQKRKKIPIGFKLIKFFSSNIFYIILLIIYIIIYQLTVTVIFLLFSFKCVDKPYKLTGILFFLFKFLHGIIILIISLTWLLVLLYDIITNIKKIFCSKNIIKKFLLYLFDTYLFRIEILIASLPILLFVIFTIVGLISPPFEITTAILNEVNLFLAHFITFLFPMIITFINEIRILINGRTKGEVIDKIMKDTFLSKEMGKFAKKEWSYENVACYNDIMKFKKEKNNLGKQYKATNIYYCYLNGKNSEFEINIDKKTCKKVLKELEKGGTLDVNLFEEVLKTLKINLADTYSRFRLTSEFRNYINKKEVENRVFGNGKEMIEE